MDELTVASLNVRGLRDNKTRKQTFNWLKKHRWNIVCLQEVHTENQEDEKLWQLQWGGPIYFSHGTSMKCGVAILINPNVNLEVTNVISDFEGRMIAIEIKHEVQSMFVFNIYAPNLDDPSFFKEVGNKIVETQNCEILLCGDFNLVMDPEIDRSEKTRYKNKAYKIVEQIIEDNDLIDIWRVRNPDKKDI